MSTLCPQDLKSLILNYQEPFIIKHVLNWNILDWNLGKWSEILDKEELEFRCGKYKFTTEPQWERSTKLITKTFKEFLEFNVKDRKKWLYFDYKYLNQNLKNKQTIHDSISWKPFGFDQFNSEDSTIWIGSEGAHTPCHKDTYGCNLVGQVYGKKRWIIFPPQEDLCSTRIPYEESSIYSKLNLFSPKDINSYQNIKKCKSIILKPGEVLFIPNGWWHYVENLEVAISINVWIPLHTDSYKQLEESLVQMFISQIIKDQSINTQLEILNPNMEKLNLQAQDMCHSLDVINVCRQNCRKVMFQVNTCTDFEEFFKMHESNLQKIPDLTNDDFFNLLQNQAERFENEEKDENEVLGNDLNNVINAFLNEDVINLVVQKLLNANKDYLIPLFPF